MTPSRTAAAIATLASMLLLASCATDIAYFGESYAPNSGNVECFFTPQDVKRPYKVMGKAVASEGLFRSYAEFQEDVINCARAHGADAILIESFQKVKTGESTSWNDNGTAHVKKKDAWWTESGSSNTQDQTALQASILFLKYTQ